MYEGYETSIIVGTVFVCLVIIRAMLHGTRNASKEAKFFVRMAVGFAVVSALILIINLLS